MPSFRDAVAVVAPPAKDYEHDPATLSYFRDLVEPFGSTVDEDLLRSAPNVSHSDLIEELAKSEEIRDSSPDVVIVAHALPDITPFTAIAPLLNKRLGGQATSFGISQQGLAAPFTALRVLSAFQRAGRSREAVLAVLEQTTLPSRFSLVHDNSLVDSGVLMHFDTGEGPSVAEVEALDSPELLAGRLVELGAKDPDRTLLVTGPWVALGEQDLPAARHAVEPGSYCTSVWLELARHGRSWLEDFATVVLCDTDPRSGTSHLAVLRNDDAPGGN